MDLTEAYCEVRRLRGEACLVRFANIANGSAVKVSDYARGVQAHG